MSMFSEVPPHIHGVMTFVTERSVRHSYNGDLCLDFTADEMK